MTRYFIGFICVLALGIMGCSETSGTGGSGGEGGSGGSAGTYCTGDNYATECISGDVEGLCLAGECRVLDCSAVGGEAFCWVPGEKSPGVGLCSGGDCVAECQVREAGAGCRRSSYPWEIGECGNGSCIPFCENDEDCFDYEECTAETCLERGLCEYVPAQDGTPCLAGGTCQSGECLSASP